MKLLISLWLLLVTQVTVSVQQCPVETFIPLELVQTTEVTDSNQIFTINSTFYNCLQTSSTIGQYVTMSVSVLYVRSDSLNTLRGVRYNLLCGPTTSPPFTWVRSQLQTSNVLQSNDTRFNCSSCSDTSVNDYHCSC